MLRTVVFMSVVGIVLWLITLVIGSIADRMGK